VATSADLCATIRAELHEITDEVISDERRARVHEWIDSLENTHQLRMTLDTMKSIRDCAASGSC
jgi:hypothetical protein